MTLRFMIVSPPAISRKFSRSRHYKWWVFLARRHRHFHIGSRLRQPERDDADHRRALRHGPADDAVGTDRVRTGDKRAAASDGAAVGHRGAQARVHRRVCHIRRGWRVRGDIGQHPDAHRVQGLAGRGREHDAGDGDGDGAVHFPERGARQGYRVVHHGRGIRERGRARAGRVHRGNDGLAVGILLRGCARIAGDPWQCRWCSMDGSIRGEGSAAFRSTGRARRCPRGRW